MKRLLIKASSSRGLFIIKARGDAQGEVILKIVHPDWSLVKSIVRSFLDVAKPETTSVEGNARDLMLQDCMEELCKNY